MRKETLRKPLFWTNLIVMLLFGLAIADVIFGWTNPPGNPPTGSGTITASGGGVGIEQSNPLGALHVGVDTLFVSTTTNQVGIGTMVSTGTAALIVDGPVDLWGNELRGLATPLASSSAATRGYVDAINMGPPGAATVLWGIATGSAPYMGPIGAQWPNCTSMLGSQWVNVYFGFGPHWIGIDEVYSWNGSGSDGAALFGGGQLFTDNDGGSGPLDPQSSSMARTALASDSVCSMSSISIVPYKLSARFNQSGQQGGFAGTAHACAEQIGGVGGDGNPVGSQIPICNICTVCMRDT